MKKIYFYLFSFLLFASCQDDSIDVPGFATEEEAVSFFVPSEGVITVEEADGLVEIVVARTFTTDAAVDVTYSVEEIGATSDDFQFVSERGTVQIPSNQANGIIILETFDNSVFEEEDKIIRLTITNASSGVTLDDSRGRVTSVDIVLVDDDTVASVFSGTYSVNDMFLENSNFPGSPLAPLVGLPGYQLDVTPEEGDETGRRIVFNASPDFFPYFANGTVATLDPDAGSITFDNDPLNISTVRDMIISSNSISTSPFSMQAAGIFGEFGEYQFILTRQ